MQTSATSRDSFQKISSKTKLNCYDKITSVLQAKPQSRTALAALTDLRLSTICARVNELVHVGILEPIGTTYDNNSRREVQLIALVEGKRD